MTEAELSKVGGPTDRGRDGKLTRLGPLRLAFDLCGLLLK
jgi:hypothetical protein